MIKAIGFDLDGTLFKTHVDYNLLNSADIQVLKKHNIDPTIIYGNNLKDRRNRLPIKNWLQSEGRLSEYSTINNEIDELSTFYEMQHIDEVKEYPRTIETVKMIKSQGFKVGLLTRGARKYGETILEKFGIRDYFDTIMGRDYADPDECKPSPVATINFAKELGVCPNEILYLGDNITDWQSAKSAGAHFIGVLSGACSISDWKRADPNIQTIQYAGDIIDILNE